MNNNRKVLSVPHSVWLKWMEIHEHGDIKAISTGIGVTRTTIRKAINKKMAKEDIQLAITHFYRRKFISRNELQKENEEKQLELLNQGL